MPDNRLTVFLTIAALIATVPRHAQSQPAGSPVPGLTATTNNPNLAVATVKLESGTRASKVIGTAVYSESNEKLGSVDDVILTDGDRATVAIVAIGGVLGVGSKLVALPYSQLKREPDRIILPGVTKEIIAAMPSFTY